MQPALSPDALSVALRSITEYAIFTQDLHGRVTMWNEGAERVFGYSGAEAIGQSVAIVYTPEDRERGAHLEEMDTARAKGSAADERYHVRKDGSRFYASGALFSVPDASGVTTGYVKVCRDLSDRRKWEQALLDERQMLEQRVAERTRQLSEELVERQQAEKRARSLLSRLITLQEQERRRIARDLHDHLGQQVTALHLHLGALKNEAQSTSSALAERVNEIQALFTQLDKDLDFFTWELRPGALYNLGLVAALTDFVTAFSQNYGLPVTFECVGIQERELHSDQEVNLYRVAQEALNNTLKHAKATRADVLLQRADARVILTISDDGVGFVPSQVDAGAVADRGMGLIGMRERATLLGGTLEIESKPNEGTSIVAIIPVVGRQEDAPRR